MQHFALRSEKIPPAVSSGSFSFILRARIRRLQVAHDRKHRRRSTRPPHFRAVLFRRPLRNALPSVDRRRRRRPPRRRFTQEPESRRRPRRQHRDRFLDVAAQADLSRSASFSFPVLCPPFCVARLLATCCCSLRWQRSSVSLLTTFTAWRSRGAPGAAAKTGAFAAGASNGKESSAQSHCRLDNRNADPCSPFSY